MYIYDVPLFNDIMISLIMRKCVVLGACDDVNLQKIVVCLLGAVHMTQCATLRYIDSLFRNFVLFHIK